MAQVLVFHKVRGEIVGPPKLINTALVHLEQAPASATGKPAASGQQTKSIAQSLRENANSSFQGVARHAGYRSCRGNKIRIY